VGPSTLATLTVENCGKHRSSCRKHGWSKMKIRAEIETKGGIPPAGSVGQRAAT